MRYIPTKQNHNVSVENIEPLELHDLSRQLYQLQESMSVTSMEYFHTTISQEGVDIKVIIAKVIAFVNAMFKKLSEFSKKLGLRVKWGKNNTDKRVKETADAMATLQNNPQQGKATQEKIKNDGIEVTTKFKPKGV